MIQHEVQGRAVIQKHLGFQLECDRQFDGLKRIQPEVEIIDIEVAGVDVLLIVTTILKAQGRGRIRD